MRLQLSVGIVDRFGKTKLCDIYQSQNGDYMGINPSINLVLRYRSTDEQWNRTQQVYINQKNRYQLIMGMKEFYRKFQRESLYRYNEKGEVTDVFPEEEDVIIVNMGMGQFIVLEPAIIYDKEENPLPGVVMRINVKSHIVDMSIDEFEGFMDTIENTNIHYEGMLLLHNYLLLLSLKRIPNQYSKETTNQPSNEKPTRNPYVSIYEIKEKKEQEEMVSAPVQKENQVEKELEEIDKALNN